MTGIAFVALTKVWMMVVALVSDLIFQSKITGVAAHLGIEVQAVRTCAAARSAASAAKGMLVDLSVNEDETIELIATLKRELPGLPIIGFFPHVEAELARRARAAGADQVLPRSRFTENLAGILRGMAGEEAHGRSHEAADGQSPMTSF